MHSQQLLRKARLAFGVAIICLLFLIETTVAHHVKPNPLSPLVWTLLGGVGAAALLASWWFKRQSRRSNSP